MMRRALLGAALLIPSIAFGQLQLSEVQNGKATPVGTALDLGSTPVNSSVAVNLQVLNTSSAAVTIQNIAVSGSGFSLPGTYAFELPYVLAPGQFWNFQAGFSPSVTGPAQGTLQVNPGLTVALTGTGTPPVTGGGSSALSISDANGPLSAGTVVDFGRVEMGSSATMSFTITNGANATASATISSLAVGGAGFTESSGPVAPFTLAAGASQTFVITFTPTVANAAQGTLSVNGENFTLTGSGFAQPFPTASIVFDQANAESGQQRTVSVTLASAATADANGNLTLTFTPSVPGATADSAIQFLNGNPTVAPVTIHKGDSTVAIGAFQTGTTTGTIGFKLTLGNGGQASQSLTIAPETVQLNTATAVAQAGQIVVSLIGFDNTHAATTLAFTFYDASGNTIQPGTITADATQAFANYFSGNEGGGAFALRAAFPVTGNSRQVASVKVQVSNPAGQTQTPSIPF